VRIRTKLLAVMILVNLAIVLAALVIIPSLDADEGVEAEALGRSNRTAMALVLQRAVADLRRESAGLAVAVAEGSDPTRHITRIRSARGVLNQQLSFLPTQADAPVAGLRAIVEERSQALDALLLPPLDSERTQQIVELARELDEKLSPTLSLQIERDNLAGQRDMAAVLQRMRARQALTLGAVFGALLLSLALTAFAYRRLLRPLGAVTDSLNAVLTGSAPQVDPKRAETDDEFGDIVRAMRRIQAQAEHIRRIAYLDPGSGLPNRNSLDAELREVRRLRPIDGTHGLLLLGIDSYVAVRSGFGTRLAEAAIRAAGERLRDLDALPTQAFRLDVETLAILVDRGTAEAVTRADLKRIAAEAMKRLVAPVEVEEQRILLALSAGGAVYPDDARDPEEYVNVCLEALRLARSEGSGHLRFGERGHTHRLRRHLALTEQIRSGLRQGQFVPFFQPIVDVSRRKVIGAETLTRWRQPDGRVTLPSEFIFVAEGSDLIAEMTHSVLSRACSTFKGWNDRGYDLRVAFNLSAKLLSANIMEIVRNALKESGLDPRQLIAEITETALVGNIDDISLVLDDLHAAGVTLSLDDFGTGHSSLSHLYRFDVSAIKIDPVLTRAAAQNPRVQEIIRSLVQLAASLDLSLIVEGVESEDDVRLMQKLGVRLMQGFYFTRAMPEEQFLDWVRSYEAGILAA